MGHGANGPRRPAELSRDGGSVDVGEWPDYRTRRLGGLDHGALSAARMLPHNRSFQLSPGTRVAVLSRGTGAPVTGLALGETTT
jgi:hypothetical protein